jgi:hypothetical protein
MARREQADSTARQMDHPAQSLSGKGEVDGRVVGVVADGERLA